jgi:Icc-related predicted phosphoesterase
MKVLASADVHGKWPVYKWLLAIVREHSVDAMILGGDLLGCPDEFATPEEAQRHEGRLLIELLDTAGIPVFYIMGNDDLVELEPQSARVRSIHGRVAKLGSFSFVGYQYSLPFMGGAFEKPEAQIRADLATLTELPGPHTVFVSHSPAFGILDPGFGENRIGSVSIRDFLEQNSFRAHIHGHCHSGFGRNGRHFNVASAGRCRSMILDLDTMQHEVLVSTLEGRHRTGPAGAGTP